MPLEHEEGDGRVRRTRCRSLPDGLLERRQVDPVAASRVEATHRGACALELPERRVASSTVDASRPR
jgi:hypothetical protein